MAKVGTDHRETDSETTHTISIASRSTLGAAFLVLNQIGSRALTFLVNQLLFRFLSPGTYGVAAQLELFSVSILYFSRESLRVALQRQRGEDGSGKTDQNGRKGPKEPARASISYEPARKMQEAVNLSHIGVGLGLPLTAIFSWLYLRQADPAVLQIRYINRSIEVYAFATVLELLNEPAYGIAQQQMLYGTRASAEFLGSFTRCMVTCALAIWASRTKQDLGVLPFAVGQMSYATILSIVYLSKVLPICHQNKISLLPKTITTNHQTHILSRFSGPLVTIAATFYGQSIFKQFQTSGDGYLIATLASLPSQGAYALATNYGGLLARILFQPIEESSRSLFGRLLPSLLKHARDSTETHSKAIAQAKSHLHTILHLYFLLTLLALSLGPPLSPLLLQTIAGSWWSATEAPAVLASYCYLIGLLAINGILEAFVTAVATPAQVIDQNFWMAGFSLVFAGTGFLVLKVMEMGAKGLVVTNAVVMVLRIWWSWRFVGAYLRAVGGKGLVLREMLPSGGSLAVGVTARGCLGLMLGDRGDIDLKTLLQCAMVVGFCGIGVVICERHFLASILPDVVIQRSPFLGQRGERRRTTVIEKNR